MTGVEGRILAKKYCKAVVHMIYNTIVFVLRFSVQISPRLLATVAFYFSLLLPRVFRLLIGLVYSTTAMTASGEKSISATLSRSACLE